MSVEAEHLDTKETEETENLPPKPQSRIKGCLKCTCFTFVFISLSFAIFAAVMGGIVSNLSTGTGFILTRDSKDDFCILF